MKFEWKYRYVPEGQIEPDKHGRWAIDCYMFANIPKSLPKYHWCEESIGEYIGVRIATMMQKDTTPGICPSLMHKFCVICPSFEDAGNTGMSTQRYYYANDIEELKTIVEEQFILIQKVFQNCK